MDGARKSNPALQQTCSQSFRFRVVRVFGHYAVEPGAVNLVFFQHKLQFLAQGLVDLTGGPSQQFFPRQAPRSTTPTG
jgi:hypothetical protein